jgi:hypothetical protein
MKLSQQTMKVLKNFASINSNLLILPGDELTTMSVSRSVQAVAKLDQPFEGEYGIYDLNEFLSTMGLVDEPTFEFSNTSVSIRGTQRSESVSYFFADKSVLAYPEKTVKMPPAELTFNINTDDLNKLIKAAGVLGHKELSFKNHNKGVIAVVNDAKNSTANTYSLLVSENSGLDNEFCFNVSISNLKLLPGNYTVSMSKLGISSWKSDEIQYYIALEKTSSFK